MIFSTVRSNASVNKRGAMGFLNDRRRLNGALSVQKYSFSGPIIWCCGFSVALTRAKAMLIVIGDPRVLGMDMLWKAFLNYVATNNGYRGIELRWNPSDLVIPPGYGDGIQRQDRTIVRGEEFMDGVRAPVIYRWHGA